MLQIPIPRHRRLPVGERTLIMGIINATPDSFYAGSRRAAEGDAVAAARQMIEEGADILDIGGESTRPGSDPVPLAVELERVLPVISAIREFSDIPISVDTRKAELARKACASGADIINDVSALRDDPEMAAFAAESGMPVVLMHMQGTPKSMQLDPYYKDPVAEVREALLEFAGKAERAGVNRDRIILDPGIGFGKRHSDNLVLLRHVSQLVATGYPVLVGASRKGFIGRVLGSDRPRPTEGRLAGSLAVHAYAALSGAHIVRVHDVADTVDVMRMLDAIRHAEGASSG